MYRKNNVLFWEMWGKKENGYIAYLEDFCLSFLPKMKEKYSVFLMIIGKMRVGIATMVC